MERINEEAWQALRKGATVLEADGFGEKVLELADGRMLKLFRRKRLLSSALLFPYARRFVTNAQRLARIGVPVPRVERLMRIPAIHRDAVLYEPLPGQSLRQLSKQGLPEEELQILRRQVDTLARHLCAHGLYFRSYHAGNIILTPEEKLGLIDFADMRAWPWSLGQSMYLRTLKTLANTDPAWLASPTSE